MGRSPTRSEIDQRVDVEEEQTLQNWDKEGCIYELNIISRGCMLPGLCLKEEE